MRIVVLPANQSPAIFLAADLPADVITAEKRHIAAIGVRIRHYRSDKVRDEVCTADFRDETIMKICCYTYSFHTAIDAGDMDTVTVINVHLKDWVELPESASNQDPFDFANTEGRRFTGEILGDGILDLPEAIRELGRLNYQGYVSIEYEGHKDPKNAT